LKPRGGHRIHRPNRHQVVVHENAGGSWTGKPQELTHETETFIVARGVGPQTKVPDDQTRTVGGLPESILPVDERLDVNLPAELGDELVTELDEMFCGERAPLEAVVADGRQIQSGSGPHHQEERDLLARKLL